MDLETEIGNFDYNLRNHNTDDDDDEAFNLIPPGTPEFKRLSCGMSFLNVPDHKLSYQYCFESSIQQRCQSS